jgi:hypothetical protein
MRRTFAAAALLAGLVASAGPDLSACGDKSLAAGGIRMQRALAARYPASVLIYAPADSRLVGAALELKLLEMLGLVGHKYREVTSHSELETSLATGQFNIVLADLADLAALPQTLQSSTSRVVVIPVAYRVTKEQARQAAKLFRFVIKAPEHPSNYLTTIANAVRSKAEKPRKA